MNTSKKRHISFGFAALLLAGSIGLSFTGPTVTTAAAPTMGTLTVNVDVINDGGGTYDASNFPIHLLNWDTSSTIDVVSGQTIDLEPGLWRFLEIASPLYQAHYSGDCSEYDNFPPGGPFPGDGRGWVVIAAGDIKSCTLSNNDWPVGQVKVKKVVLNDEGGTKVSEDFMLTVSSTFGAYTFPGNNSSPLGPLYAGTVIPVGTGAEYNVTEPSHPGYFPSFSADCTGTVTWGQLKECTVTNEDTTKGRMTFNTVVINDGGGTYDASNFPLHLVNWDTSTTINIVSGQTIDLEPGLWRFLEIASPLYQAHYSGACSEYDNFPPGGPFPENGRGFFTLEAGEIKGCTLTNNDWPVGQVKVKKLVINDEGGTAKPEDFMLTVTSTFGAYTFPGTSTSPFGPLYAGTVVPVGTSGSYSVLEPSHPGYFPSFSADCFGTVTWGQFKECTVTNEDTTKGRVTFHVNVINNSGGNYTAANFPLHLVNWDTSSTIDIVDGQTIDLDPGLWRFLEIASMFYHVQYSGDCNEYTNPIPGGPFPGDGRGFFTLQAGDIKSCTITNDDTAAGYMFVKKLVVNDNGGTSKPEDFMLSVSSSLGVFNFQGTSTSPYGPAYFGGSKVFMSTDGTYEVTEQAYPGYTATFSPECSGTVGWAELKYCTVTNNDIGPVTTGSMTVHTVVINDDGGNYDASNFPLRIVNWDTSTTYPMVDGQTIDLPPGKYRFLEIASMFYHALYSGDCNEYYNPVPGGPFDGDSRGFFVIGVGDVKSCTLTNDDTPAGIVMVKKLVVNDNGGTKKPEDFTLFTNSSLGYFSYQGTSTSPLGPLYAGTKTFVSSTSTFQIGEIADPGYTATYEGNCSGTVAWGTAVHCNVINNDIDPTGGSGGGRDASSTATIIVQTVVINDNGFSFLPSDFSLSIAANSSSVTNFIGNANGTVITVAPGAYSVTEAQLSTYLTTLGVDCSGTIAAGETKTCVVTNNDQGTSGGGGGGTGGGGGSGGGGGGGGSGGSGGGGGAGGGSIPVPPGGVGGGSLPPPPGEVLGAVDEDPSGDPTGSTNDPADPADPSNPTELPRTGLPIGLALAAFLPLGLYAKRKK